MSPRKCAALAVWVACVLSASAASASHFRFGHITWRPRPDLGPNRVEFTITASFRRCGYNGTGADGCPKVGDTIRETVGNTSFMPGDGTTIGSPLSFEVVAINTVQDWLIGRAEIPGSGYDKVVIHRYASATAPGGGPWMAAISSCCRIRSSSVPPHLNNPDGNYRVLTRVDLSRGNTSPISSGVPIVDCFQNSICRFVVPGADADRDPLRWRLSTDIEASGTTGGFVQPGPPFCSNALGVDPSNGIVTWNTTGCPTALYSTQITLEDLDGAGAAKSSVAIDFFVNVTEQGANSPPAFVSPPTPLQPLAVSPTELLSFDIRCTDPDAGNLVFLNNAGLPTGMTCSAPAPAQTVNSLCTWTPTAQQVGVYLVTYTCADNFGANAPPHAVQITVRGCGNGVVDAGEQCDGAADSMCSGMCVAPGQPNECQCPPPPTATSTRTPTGTPTQTATSTSTPTITPTPSITPTVSQTPTITSTPTITDTPPPSPTPPPSATPSNCGNGRFDGREECDDGNRQGGDGCDGRCRRERASCCANPNITCNDDFACPDGDTCCNTHCDTGSNPPACDGLGTACDDASHCAPGSMCCAPVCGNGFLEEGEECDEGTDNGAPACGCTAECRFAGLCSNDPTRCCLDDSECDGGTCCGNGIVTPPEQCDDLNRIDDDTCSNSCEPRSGIGPCSGFFGNEIVPAAIKVTRLRDRDKNTLLERWTTRGSALLSPAQAMRFDPQHQFVQQLFSERDETGERLELWPTSHLLLPSDCLPNPFCFLRIGEKIRRFSKVREIEEVFSPGLQRARFRLRSGRLRYRLRGRQAEIQRPGSPLSGDSFLVRQDTVVGNICLSAQLTCRSLRNSTYYLCTRNLP